MSGSDWLDDLRTAVESESEADALAAIARSFDPEAEAPTPEALAEWLAACPETEREEADARLRKLAALTTPYAPPALTEGCTVGAVSNPAGDPVRLAASWPLAIRFKETNDGWTVSQRVPPDDPAPPDAEWVALLLTVAALSRRWLAARDREDCPDHPLGPIVRAWIEAHPRGSPQPPTQRHLVATRERHPPKGSDPLILTRQPGILSLVSHAPLEAVEVDGRAFVTRTIGGRATDLRRYKLADSQGDLFPGPRTLADNATAGALFEAVAFLVLNGDERSPLRADLLRLANMAFALSGPTEWSEEGGAHLVGGRDSTPNRERFHAALWALRGMSAHVPSGRPHGDRWWPMADAHPDPARNVIGPPRWWRRYMDAIRGTRRGSQGRRTAIRATGLVAPVAWRYTGSLFVPASKWGAVERTVSGIEAALLWGSSPGRGTRGDRPDNVIPVRNGGPGREVKIPWWQVLRLSGENVGPEADPKGKDGRRYGRRCGDLERAGYFTERAGTAEAGGTVEVVERVRGSRARQAGLIVRASARYCAAYGLNERVHVPVSRLLAVSE